jgi:DeoR/GlpR family transcriptional regulator of sugar metabolism
MTTEEKIISSIERQEQICALIEREKRVTVAQICNIFSVSEATARRDLETLSDQGKVHRVHGGAIQLRYAPPEKPLNERSGIQYDEKRRIGQLTATLIKDGETIFMGSGSTVYEVARNLHGKKDLTIITNSLLVVNELAEKPDFTIICVGGGLRKSEMSFIGHIAQQSLADVRADKVIMGIRAISIEQGLTNDYLPETMTDRTIMSIANELIVVADYTKCERVATAFVAPIERVNTLVTTTETPAEFVESLTSRGVNVLLA